MKSRTKAILKTTGAVLVGAAAFAYLPLVSFAVAPQAMGWLHLGLATVHPLLGDALLGAGILSTVGFTVKKIWGKYFAEKRMERKIKEILKQQKELHEKEVVHAKQQEITKQRHTIQQKPTKTHKTKKLSKPALTALKNRRERNAA